MQLRFLTEEEKRAKLEGGRIKSESSIEVLQIKLKSESSTEVLQIHVCFKIREHSNSGLHASRIVCWQIYPGLSLSGYKEKMDLPLPLLLPPTMKLPVIL